MAQIVLVYFAPHYAPSRASVAQWIERRFPKPQVVGSIPTGGASKSREFFDLVQACDAHYSSLTRSNAVSLENWEIAALGTLSEFRPNVVSCLLCGIQFFIYIHQLLKKY